MSRCKPTLHLQHKLDIRQVFLEESEVYDYVLAEAGRGLAEMIDGASEVNGDMFPKPEKFSSAWKHALQWQ